ncbi:hypothetical protein [Brevundimonas goettingensis]|uniref:Lipoprotein n=1 Tax=Brevundimonas goettingensis TaxID=2774190 RepID=A0A975C0S8_9CAUL|nr:hypothetical protein [Brevundimonas goettingensis]QTC91758.1 hypothetical protein IFJ75_02150 [Brevundimonas goettingensis]
MNRLVIVAAVVATGVLSACDTIPKYGSRSLISLADQQHQTIGSLFVWSNDVNAGMITRNGEVCMQRAMTTRTSSFGGSASAPSSLIDLSKAARTAADKGDEAAAIQLAAAYREAAASLSTTTERTAFLDIGMFYICQLEANGAISQSQAALLTQQLIRDTATMVPVTGSLVASTSPTLPSITASGGTVRDEEPSPKPTGTAATGIVTSPPPPPPPPPPVD